MLNHSYGSLAGVLRDGAEFWVFTLNASTLGDEDGRDS